jgi:hypothetical protein
VVGCLVCPAEVLAAGRADRLESGLEHVEVQVRDLAREGRDAVEPLAAAKYRLFGGPPLLRGQPVAEDLVGTIGVDHLDQPVRHQLQLPHRQRPGVVEQLALTQLDGLCGHARPEGGDRAADHLGLLAADLAAGHARRVVSVRGVIARARPRASAAERCDIRCRDASHARVDEQPDRPATPAASASPTVRARNSSAAAFTRRAAATRRSSRASSSAHTGRSAIAANAAPTAASPSTTGSPEPGPGCGAGGAGMLDDMARTLRTTADKTGS